MLDETNQDVVEEIDEGSATLDENVFDDAWGDDEVTPSDETEEEDKALDQEPETESEEQNDQQEQAEGNETKPTDEADTEMFTLRYMQEDKQYSKAETTVLAQKGLDYDRIREERDGLKQEQPKLKRYESFLKELAEDSGTTIDEMVDQVLAAKLVERERKAGNVITDSKAKSIIQNEWSAETQQDSKKETTVSEPTTGTDTQGNKAANKQQLDIAAFVKAYPDVKANEIPQSVWDEVRNGSDLVSAYTRYDNKQLRSRLETLEQNKKNAERSTGSRKSVGNKGQTDDFDTAWDED
jgi:hypothetical protein